MPAPDSGYTPTSVMITVQGVDAENVDSDIAQMTIPYGGKFFTDQLVTDIQTAVTTAVLAAYPGGQILRSDIAYTGSAVVSTLQPAP